MAERLKHKYKNKVQPDEVQIIGHIRLIRIGNKIILENTMNREQHSKHITELASKYDDYCKEIDDIVQKIRSTVQRVNPLKLLQRAYGEYAACGMGKTSEFEMNGDDIIALRMIDYIQSVIVSSPPLENNDLTEAIWHELRGDVKKLYGMLSWGYHTLDTAKKKVSGIDFDIEYEEFYVKAQMHWTAVRGHRYLVHDMPHLRDLLTEHDLVFKEIYGASIEQFLQGIEKLQNSLAFGIFEAAKELRELHAKIVAQVDASLVTTKDEMFEAMEKILKDNGFEAERDDIFSRFFGFDLFDIVKVTNLPASLLRDLSWEPGENRDFFAEGDKSGWPLKILPIHQRPLLKIEEKYYCFDLLSLMDNLYKALRRTILRIKPSYQETWNAIQKRVTEELPLKLLGNILKGSKTYSEVYYRWNVGKNGQLEWCENDGILLYDDHLIIIEVKGGAFTYTSPSDDFDAFIQSIRNLAIKPAEQGIRFIEYLNSASEVEIYDKDHTLVAKLKKKQFRCITLCCVSLDNFTTFAARIGNLKALGLKVPQPIWSISIDDMRVYADLFVSATQFTHFLEERQRACLTPEIDLDDELDHYGLYVHYNRYTSQTKDINMRMVWNGFRQEIDTYYHNLLTNSTNSVRPTQKLPGILQDIILLLDTQVKPGRCKAASLLLDFSVEDREQISNRIQEGIIEQKSIHRMKPLSTIVDPKITFFCRTLGVQPMLWADIEEHVFANMVLSQEKMRMAMLLKFDHNNTLVNVDFQLFHEYDIRPSQLLAIQERAKKLRKSRMKNERSKRFIGRNHPCPCGSGKKYKSCCGKK